MAAKRAVVDAAAAKRWAKAWDRYVARELGKGRSMGDIKQASLAADVATFLSDPFTPQTLSKIMSGRQRPSGDQLVAIAHFMGETDLVALSGVGARPAGFKKEPKRQFHPTQTTKKQRGKG